MPFCLVLSKCLRIQIDNLVHEWLIFAILNANFLGTHSNKISGVNFHSIKWPKANLFDTWLTYNVNQNQIRWPYIKGGFWSDFYDILLQQYSIVHTIWCRWNTTNSSQSGSSLHLQNSVWSVNSERPIILVNIYMQHLAKMQEENYFVF